MNNKLTSFARACNNSFARNRSHSIHTHTLGRTCYMELFSRRRWRLVSAQVVSCCVYEESKNYPLHSIQVWILGQSRCSPFFYGRAPSLSGTVFLVRSCSYRNVKILHQGINVITDCVAAAVCYLYLSLALLGIQWGMFWIGFAAGKLVCPKPKRPKSVLSANGLRRKFLLQYPRVCFVWKISFLGNLVTSCYR